MEYDKVDLVRTILQKAKDLNVRVRLPKDVVATEKIESGATARIVSTGQIPAGLMIADIGPRTIEEFVKELKICRTVGWNGPLGVFEIPQFSEGTRSIATVLSGLNATTVIGGRSAVGVCREDDAYLYGRWCISPVFIW